MAQLFANNVRSALSGAITNVATTINVTAGTGSRFPSPAGGDFFLATLVGLDGNGNESAWEIVKCTGRAGDVLTVVRGQEGTSNVAWSSGITIEMRYTAASADHGASIAAAASKATPVDGDLIGLSDSAASNVFKKFSWANLKATLKAYLDTLYLGASATAAAALVLAIPRAINGVSFDGSGDIEVIATGTHAATSKATPVDADELSLVDSAASNVLKKLTWASLKATLKAYLDTLYAPVGASAPGLVLLATANPSGVATCDFTSGIDGTYEEYELHYINLVPSSSGAVLYLRTSSDGGGSWPSSSSDYITNGSQGAQIAVSGNTVNLTASNGGASGVLKIFDPAGIVSYKQITGLGAYVGNTGNTQQSSFGGARQATAAINGLRLFFSSGNIASGKVKLYGVKKS